MIVQNERTIHRTGDSGGPGQLVQRITVTLFPQGAKVVLQLKQE